MAKRTLVLASKRPSIKEWSLEGTCTSRQFTCPICTKWCWTLQGSFLGRNWNPKCLNQIDAFFLTPFTTDKHPPNRELEESRERRWCHPVQKKTRCSLLNGWEQCYVRIEFWVARIMIPTDWFWFLGLPRSIPLSLRRWKYSLRRSCSFCSLPLFLVLSTTSGWGYSLSESMVEFPGPIVVHNTCVFNLSPLGLLFESWVLLLRMGAAYIGVVCAGMWVLRPDIFWK